MIQHRPFFCSWSGGKDSCLALYKAIQAGGDPTYLLTMMTEEGKRSRAHGLSQEVLGKQAESLGIPLMTAATSWKNYEQVLRSSLDTLRDKGVEAGVFGDIDLVEHREWIEGVCEKEQIAPYFPLWNRGRVEVVQEFVRLGFQAVIVAVQEGVLSESFLGEPLTAELIDHMIEQGIDPAGEAGEYHTVVAAGPIFKKPISFSMKDRSLRDGYWYLDISL